VGSSYRQFCPVAKAIELFDERWTMLIVRELVTGSLRSLVEVWRGDLGWSDVLRSGELEVNGPEALRRAMPGWFTLSQFAPVPRPA